MRDFFLGSSKPWRLFGNRALKDLQLCSSSIRGSHAFDLHCLQSCLKAVWMRTCVVEYYFTSVKYITFVSAAFVTNVKMCYIRVIK